MSEIEQGISKLCDKVAALTNSIAIKDVRIAELELAIAGALVSLEGSPDYHHSGMGCGLEDRNIHNRYEAIEYGWEQAMERVYGENIAWAKDELTAALEPKP